MYTGNSGYYQVKNPQKYRGDINNIVYRSNLELKFMIWLDKNNSVIEWGSETVIVPYYLELDQKYHRYFLDFYIKIKDKDGNIQKYLIEIKPEKFTKPPETPKNKSKRYIKEVVQYVTNESKWKAATKFCEERKMKFLILTEKDLNG